MSGNEQSDEKVLRYIKPDTSMLKTNDNLSKCIFEHERLSEMVHDLEDYLKGHNAEVKVVDASSYGSESLLFEIELSTGTRVKSITKYKQELSVLFSANDIDFLIPVPGKTHLGIVVTFSVNKKSLLVGDIIR